jgi:superfamily II DNA or RNA helicase
MKVTVKLGVLYSKLPDLPVEDRQYLAEAMAVQVKGARFIPQVRMGLWDGYKKFFQPVSGTFLTGLLAHVTALLKARGISVEVDAERLPPLTPRMPLLPSKVTLRDYQAAVVPLALTQRRGIIHAAVNSGKSEMAMEIIRQLRLTTLYLVPSKELHRQMLAMVAARLPGMDVGEIKADTFRPGLLTVAMQQSVITAFPDPKALKRRALTARQQAMRDWIRDDVECLMADEIHHSTSERWSDVFKHARRAQYRYGFSATPYGTSDVRDMLLVGLTGPTLGSVTTPELVARGLSVKTDVQFIKYDAAGFALREMKGNEYQAICEAGIDENAARVAGLWTVLIPHLQQKHRILIMVDTINGGDYIRSRLQERLAPWPKLFPQTLYGPDKERERILERFTSGTSPILITTLLKEGVNIPEIDVLVNAGAKASAIRTIQQAGRVLRTRSGKATARIYDFVDPAHALLLEHSRKRYRAYKAEGFTVDLIDGITG